MGKPIQTTTPRRAAVLRAMGDAIREARRKAGLTRRQAGEALGVDHRTVQSWELGRRGCLPELRRRIVAEWGGDPKILGPGADNCPCCGRPWAW